MAEPIAPDLAYQPAELSSYSGGGIYLAATVMDAIRAGWTADRLAELLGPMAALKDPEHGALFVPDSVYEATEADVYRAVYPGWPTVRPEYDGDDREAWLRGLSRRPVAV